MESDPGSPRTGALAGDAGRERAPGSSESAFNAESRIYVRDHAHKEYIISYKRGKDWTVIYGPNSSGCLGGAN